LALGVVFYDEDSTGRGLVKNWLPKKATGKKLATKKSYWGLKFIHPGSTGRKLALNWLSKKLLGSIFVKVL